MCCSVGSLSLRILSRRFLLSVFVFVGAKNMAVGALLACPSPAPVSDIYDDLNPIMSCSHPSAQRMTDICLCIVCVFVYSFLLYHFGIWENWISFCMLCGHGAGILSFQVGRRAHERRCSEERWGMTCCTECVSVRISIACFHFKRIHFLRIRSTEMAVKWRIDQKKDALH